MQIDLDAARTSPEASQEQKLHKNTWPLALMVTRTHKLAKGAPIDGPRFTVAGFASGPMEARHILAGVEEPKQASAMPVPWRRISSLPHGPPVSISDRHLAARRSCLVQFV